MFCTVFFIIFVVIMIFNWFKKKKNRIEKVELPINSMKKDTPPSKKEWMIGGILFKVGDKVIGRSNECDPLLVGHIVDFFDNNGKWTNCIPYVQEEGTNEIWGMMGILLPYSTETIEKIKHLHPLEQWNLLSNPDAPKYTADDIVRKQEQYDKRNKIKNK